MNVHRKLLVRHYNSEEAIFSSEFVFIGKCCSIHHFLAENAITAIQKVSNQKVKAHFITKVLREVPIWRGILEPFSDNSLTLHNKKDGLLTVHCIVTSL